MDSITKPLYSTIMLELIDVGTDVKEECVIKNVRVKG